MYRKYSGLTVTPLRRRSLPVLLVVVLLGCGAEPPAAVDTDRDQTVKSEVGAERAYETVAVEIVEPEREPALIVKLSGAPSTTGEYYCALFADEADFRSRENAVATIRIPVQDASEWIVEDISAGDYAIAVYHDANSNGKLDRHFVGYPLEAYGFSNNARAKMGPPAFAAATVRLGEGPVELAIQVK